MNVRDILQSRLVRENDFLILFLAVISVYLLRTCRSLNGDTFPAMWLPWNIFYFQSLSFDHVMGMYFTPTYQLFPHGTYQIIQTGTTYASIFPIVTPLLVLPFSILPLLIQNFFHVPLFSVTTIEGMVQVSRVSSAFIAALSVVFIYLAQKELFNIRIALLGTLIYAFATSTWAISSQALWQHGTIELFLAILLYLVIRNEKEPNTRNLACMGMVSGLFAFARPPDAVLLIPVIFYVAWYARDRILSYLVPAVIAGLPFLAYNLVTFENPFGGYGTLIPLMSLGPERILFFFGNWISPNKGMLFLSPVLILGILGYLYIRECPNKRLQSFFWAFIPVILLDSIIYCIHVDWGGGYAFGYRFLLGTVPVLVILGGLTLTHWLAEGSGLKKTVILVLFLLSLTVQVVGVYFFQCIWDYTLPDAWDITHLQVVGNVAGGSARVFSSYFNMVPLVVAGAIGVIFTYLLFSGAAAKEQTTPGRRQGKGQKKQRR